jgi:predicted amidophosphoribosyltransferase
MALSICDPSFCVVCDRQTDSDFAFCYCCHTLVRQLQMPLAPVMVVTDYRLGDPMHRRLRGYKDATVAETRQMFSTALARLVGSWLAANHDRIGRRFGSGWDVVVTVPSTHLPIGARVDAVVDLVPELSVGHRTLLERGPEATDHLRAARRGYEVIGTVDRAWLRRRNVLVFDDTITTGARAQSAVAALRLAGARVAGVMAVGRAIGVGAVDVVSDGGANGCGLAVDRPSARHEACSCESSPNPNRVPPTISYWQSPRRRKTSASTASSEATTTWRSEATTDSPVRLMPG